MNFILYTSVLLNGACPIINYSYNRQVEALGWPRLELMRMTGDTGPVPLYFKINLGRFFEPHPQPGDTKE